MNRLEVQKKPSRLFIRWAVFMIGLIIMSFGISMMIRADLGSAPWDVLHVGLTLQVGLTVGSWSIIMGFLIIGLTSLLTKEWPKLGGFVNMVLVGVFIDIFLWILPTPEGLFFKLAMLLIGLVVIGYGIGLYIAPQLGAGPRDSLMIAIQMKTGWKVQWVRGAMEVVVLSAGWVLGGPIFIGTLLFCFGIGSIVGVTMPQCQRFVDILLERGSTHENFNQGTLRTHHHDGISEKVR
nr:YitT family protein [Bacillus sp. FJAT-45037]